MRALASLRDGWWEIEVPEVHARTSARTLETAEAMAVDMVALLHNLPPGSIKLDLQVR